MVVLAIDTSGRNGSVALCECAAGDCRVLELVALTGGTYSALLMPQISALLARHHLHKQSIDVFAAASGPGSFTGLRVGLSTVKALAEALAKPIVAVSLLEALAWTAGRTAARVSGPGTHGPAARATCVITALDAGRGQVFLGEYQTNQDALPELVRETLLTFAEFIVEAEAAARVPIITPDESLAGVLKNAGLPLTTVAPAQADLIARVGALKLAAGQVVSPEQLDANYIRRSDAEIFSR